MSLISSNFLNSLLIQKPENVFNNEDSCFDCDEHDEDYYYEPIEMTDLERMILEVSEQAPEHPPMPDEDEVLCNYQMIYKKRKKNFELSNEEIEKFLNYNSS